MSLKYEPSSEPDRYRNCRISGASALAEAREREFFIDNLLVRTHFINVMIRWTGLAPWEFEFHFPGSLTSTFPNRSLPQLLHLDVGDNHVGDSGASALAEARARESSLLTTYWSDPLYHRDD